MSTNEDIWKSVDRRRRSYLPGNVRVVSNNLRRAIQPILDSLTEFNSSEDALEEAPNKLDDRYIENAYLELYNRTVPEFAVRSLREVQKNEDVLRDIWNEEIRRYVQSGVIADRIVMVTDTTKNRVRGLIQKGIDQGLSIQDISTDIDKLGLDQIIRNRSTVIARTETVNASNRAAMMGYNASGLDLRKVWISTPGGRTRFDHADTDGQTVDMNGTFRVGGFEAEYPGDPNLPPGQCINCRCAIAAVE